MNRRRFLAGAAALPLVAPAGRSLVIEGRDYALTDIVTPAAGDNTPSADYYAAAMAEILKQGALSGPPPVGRDRWGRVEGAIGWRTSDRRETTLQEMLLSQGAARVAPASDDHSFIERCFIAERAAREARLGGWRFDDWRIRDAATPERSRGFQIYAGAIASASERKGRVFFNFGAEYRSDFTASVATGAFRRWRVKPDLSLLAGRRAEVRGHVEDINGPSIDLVHEMQLRLF